MTGQQVLAKLVKMAILDNKKGRSMGFEQDAPDAARRQKFNYSHVLTPLQRARGYRIHLYVNQRKFAPGHNYEAHIVHSNKSVGSVTGRFFDEPSVKGDQKRLHIVYGDMNESHQGKGLGKAMYEALMTHAAHTGATRVTGSSHSSMAHRVHSSLAAKHGLNYSAEADPGVTKLGPFDDKFGDYGYDLK